MSIRRIRTNERMSQIVVHGDTIYLAGQVADDAAADIRGQTRQVLGKIDALLSEVSSDKTRVLAANIWLTTMADFAHMNKEWDAWLTAGSAPVRATVQATLFTPAHKIEIAIIAAK
jgi:enamine deaminase RidA (YjgF/YER057c/UK114 family)